MQSAYPSTIVKLDPTYPLRGQTAPDPYGEQVTRTFVPEQFAEARPASSAKMAATYRESKGAYHANLEKASSCHISWAD